MLLTTIGSIQAQDYFSFYNLGDYIAQSTNVSPVYLPKNGFTFGTPANVGTYLDAGFQVNDLLVPSENDEFNKYDFNNLLTNIEPENTLTQDINASVFMLAFRTKKGSITVFANTRVTTSFEYSDDFISFLANGIESFNMNTDKISTTAFNEIGIGLTRTFFNDKLAIGFRAKYLNGISHASTSKDAAFKMDVNTSNSEYTVSASNATLNTAGIANNIELFESDEEIDIQETIFTGNTGFGFDIGATYSFSKKFSIEVAVNDIGSITWEENVVNYNIEDLDNAVFDGVNLDTETGSLENALLDRFAEVVPMNETTESFETELFMKSYASIKYQITDKNAFNLVAFNNHAYGNFEPRYSLGYNRTLKKTTFGILASTGQEDGEINYGVNFAVNLGPLQFYAATDSLYDVINSIEEATGANGRLGLNFVFGYKKKVKEVEGFDAPDATPSEDEAENNTAE